MARDHFSQMYKNSSHRHDTDHDSMGFEKAVGTITGMLYSIITLKAFFPFFRSPEKITDNTITNSPYPMPLKKAGDQEEQDTQLPLW